MNHLKKIIVVVCISIFSFSCGEQENQIAPAQTQVANNDVSQDKEGVVRVFDVPEMISLCLLDSCNMNEAPSRFSKIFSTLESDLTAIDAQLDGPRGLISYNNNPKNFKFECVLLIKEIPKKQPKNCQIVVLEATKMLIYNSYGDHKNLSSAYDNIKNYMASQHLTQNGPMREFYITDPSTEKNPQKWLTRIMLPI